jgi:hypothetical protein
MTIMHSRSGKCGNFNVPMSLLPCGSVTMSVANSPPHFHLFNQHCRECRTAASAKLDELVQIDRPAS